MTAALVVLLAIRTEGWVKRVIVAVTGLVASVVTGMVIFIGMLAP